MAFIRTKKFKRKNGNIIEYAYIVENRWKWKRTRQKSKKYLGKVIRLERKSIMDFYEYYDIDDVEKYLAERSKEEILLDLIKLELFNYGFEKEKGIWARDNCYFDEKSIKIFNEKGNPVALAFNEGFLTSYAIKNLLEFVPGSEEEGYDFAKMFVEAGISVPQDVFVGVFRKVFK